MPHVLAQQGIHSTMYSLFPHTEIDSLCKHLNLNISLQETLGVEEQVYSITRKQSVKPRMSNILQEIGLFSLKKKSQLYIKWKDHYRIKLTS